MKRNTANLAIFSLTVIFGFCVSVIWRTQQEGSRRKSAASKEIIELTQRLNDALIRQDIGVLEYVAADELIWSEGGDYALNWNKSEWLRQMADGSVKIIAINIDNIKVEINGNDAVMTGRITGTETFGVYRHRSEVPYTYPIAYRFKLYEGRWKLVSTRYDGAI